MAEKYELWRELACYVNSLSRPFLILGDFNELSSIQDKQGGAQFSFSRVDRFVNVLSSTNYVELIFFGQPFTWRMKKGGVDNTLERLDKAIASPNWFNLFPSAKL